MTGDFELGRRGSCALAGVPKGTDVTCHAGKMRPMKVTVIGIALIIATAALAMPLLVRPSAMTDQRSEYVRRSHVR
jgi:hypothetical protein